MDPVKIGAAIRTLRLRVGYTQGELAYCLNVTDKAVSKWERGLSVPDISIVAKLAGLLNCDVDNLLEGNITYLEKDWQGLLRLKKNPEIYAGSELYGKPLVDVLIGYFMLAGIRDIFVACPERDRRFIAGRLGDGAAFGIRLSFLPEAEALPPSEGNTMVVCDNPFVYGPYLTRCFQRAMSRRDGVSQLTIQRRCLPGETEVSFNMNRRLQASAEDGERCVRVPVFFFPRPWFRAMAATERLGEETPLYAEPLDNGVVEYPMGDRDALLDTAFFFRYIERRLGKALYNLDEIARRRNLLDGDGL